MANLLTLGPSRISPRLRGILTLLGLCAAVYSLVTTPDSLAPPGARVFCVGWLAVSVVFTFVVGQRSYVVGFLGALFALLAGWRIPGLLGVDLVAWALLPAFIAFVVEFADTVITDLRRSVPVLSMQAWQLTFLRIYVGFDMVPHFTEKLFAGPAPFNDDVAAFASFGLPMPGAFVVLGGLCELGIAIGLGTGFLTRLAVLGGSVYFLIATVLGGHFGNGFIWASPNGGWEYPVLMMVLMLSYAIPGAGRFSVDGEIGARGRWPGWARRFASG